MPQKVKCKFCSKREEKNHSSIIQCATCRGYCKFFLFSYYFMENNINLLKNCSEKNHNNTHNV